jgi:hypothetical protein
LAHFLHQCSIGDKPSARKEIKGQENMKRYLITAIAIAGTVLSLGYKANANVIEVSLDPTTHDPSDVPFNDVVGGGGGNQEEVIRAWLDGEILSYLNNKGVDLPDPTPFTTKYDNLNGVPPAGGIDVQAGDYLVLHYGVGQGGVPGTGGGLLALFFDAPQTYQVPATGAAGNFGPNGLGGISFVYLFDHTSVPDGGATVLLLGTALTGLALLRRKVS